MTLHWNIKEDETYVTPSDSDRLTALEKEVKRLKRGIKWDFRIYFGGMTLIFIVQMIHLLTS